MTELPDWQRGMALMGEHAPGDLRVIKLDDAGRISAFVIDSSDAWEEMLSIGNAELAARLGSLVHHDRRGQVTYLDDFSQGTGEWVLSGNGVGNEQIIVPTPSLNGGYAVKLTAGAAVGTMAQAFTCVPAVPTGSVGAAAIFSLGTAPDRVELNIKYYTGARVHWYTVRWDLNTELLRVRTGLAAWTQVAANVTPYYDEHFFNYIKLVFDADEEYYTRLLLNELGPDVTACERYSIGDVTTARIEAWVQVYSDVVGNDIIYLDSMVITTNEPT